MCARNLHICKNNGWYTTLWSTKLCTKSNISRIKTALRDRELIDITKDGIFLEDPVFKIWLKLQEFQ